MKDNWPDKAMDLLAILEGTKIHEVEGDAGGKTSGYGVTQKTYNSYLESKGLAPEDISNIQIVEIYEILKTGYWIPCHCDQWDSGIDLAVFQMAVNFGPGRANRIMQRIAGVKPDGVIGDISISAILCCDTTLFLESLFDHQINRYHVIVKRKPDQAKFLKGWINRVKKTAEFLEFAYMPPSA